MPYRQPPGLTDQRLLHSFGKGQNETESQQGPDVDTCPLFYTSCLDLDLLCKFRS